MRHTGTGRALAERAGRIALGITMASVVGVSGANGQPQAQGAQAQVKDTPRHLHPKDLPPGAELPDPSPPYLHTISQSRVKNRPEAVSGTLTAISGTAFLPVVLVDFNDNHAEAALHPPSAYQDMLFDVGYPHGAGSMRDFYLDQSGGLFDVDGAVSDSWHRMPLAYSAYVGSSYGYQVTQPNDWTLVRDAAEAADADMDFCDGDTDGDGYVDVLFVVHAGAGAEEGGDEDSIWSVRWSLPPALEYETDDTCANDEKVKIKDFTIEPEEFLDDAYSAPGAPERLIAIGVFAHEFGHALGLPDLYDVDGSSPGGVGEWDLMAAGAWGVGGRPWRPTPFSAWSKTELGWAIPQNVGANLDDEVIASVDEPHVGAFTGIYRLAKDGSSAAEEYFLVENRTPVGWAADFPIEGLAVWHVDETQRRTDNTDNADDDHRLLDLLQADSLDELGETGAGWAAADSGDLFPGTSWNQLLTDTTVPGTNLDDGTSSGVSVADIGGAAPNTADLLVSGVPTPPNDDFAAARVLVYGAGLANGTNAGAAKEVGEPDHAGNPGGHSVWYVWTAPADGMVAFDTSGSSFDTLLGVYSGTEVGALFEVAANDDADGGVQSRVVFQAAAGFTYQIAVDGRDGATGSVALNYASGHDVFAFSEVMNGDSGSVEGLNFRATKEAGEPYHAGNAGGASLWYRWTAPTDGTFAVDTLGSSFDTLLAVYTGSSVSTLTLVDSNDDDPDGGLQSRIDPFDVTAGTTYHVAVDGYDGETGAITLNWLFVGVVDSDDDGVADSADKCPLVYDPQQGDLDGDGVGNTCDETPGVAADTHVLYANLRDAAGAPVAGADAGGCVTFLQVNSNNTTGGPASNCDPGHPPSTRNRSFHGWVTDPVPSGSPRWVDVTVNAAGACGKGQFTVRVLFRGGTYTAVDPCAAIVGDASANTLTGTAGNDIIVGGGGNDTISALGGNDVVSGGAGNDTLRAGGGDDLVSGEAGSDTLRFSDSPAGVTASLTSNTVTGGEGTDRLGEVEHLAGSIYVDSLVGDGGANTLNGGSGNDTIDGRLGADALQGGTGYDRVLYTNRSVTVTLSPDGVAGDGQAGENDNIGTDVERLVGGSGNDQVTGSAVDNRLEGGPGADELFGLAGKDVLVGGPGPDVFHGGDSSDTALYDERTAAQPVTVSIDGTANDGETGEGDNVLADVERLYGGAAGDTLTGSDDPLIVNIIYGLDGNDLLRGGGGKDNLYGGLDNDNLFGGLMNDALFGQEGNDNLDGEGGSDTCRQDAGTGTLTSCER